MCICYAPDETYLHVLDSHFTDWYRLTKCCTGCTQRAITLVLQLDHVEYFDKLLRWTNCHKYIMEIFLTAWVHRRICIVTFLFTLFGKVFPAHHIYRVFYEYQFTSDLEKDVAIYIAENYEEFLEPLQMCALLVEQPMDDLIDHVRMLSVVSDYLSVPS